MKDLLSLKRAITDNEYYENMFNKIGTDKNILFVSPQLSGKHLYKSLLLFHCLPEKTVNGELAIATGITSLKPYDYRKQLIEYEIELSDKQIFWADFIVFPFTTQPLSQDIYKRIRALSPSTKIMFSVDFNFYELSDRHPYKNIFSDEMILNQVEDNMYFSDVVIVDNLFLVNYLLDKFKKLMEGKYQDVQGYMSLSCFPSMIDSEIVLKNVDYETDNASFIKSESIHTDAVNELIEETAKAEQKLKDEFFKNKNAPIEPLENNNSIEDVLVDDKKTVKAKPIPENKVKSISPIKKKAKASPKRKKPTKKIANGKDR